MFSSHPTKVEFPQVAVRRCSVRVADGHDGYRSEQREADVELWVWGQGLGAAYLRLAEAVDFPFLPPGSYDRVEVLPIPFFLETPKSPPEQLWRPIVVRSLPIRVPEGAEGYTVFPADGPSDD